MYSWRKGGIVKLIGISLIIPVYNVEKYLEDCLNSVINQSFTNIEIICVEDCSTDQSRFLLSQISKRDSRIRVIYNEHNMGLSASRNRGMKEAKGKYIYFLDSDDMIQEDALDELYKLSEQTDIDILYFNTKQILEQGVGNEYSSYKEHHTYYTRETVTGRQLFLEFMRRRDFDETVWRQFYNRRFLTENNILFVEGYVHEDTLFSLEAILRAKRVRCVPLVCHIYRRRNGSITVSAEQTINRLFGDIYIYQKLFDYLDICEDDEIGEQLEKMLRNNGRAIAREYKKLDSIDPMIIKKNKRLFRILSAVTTSFYGGFFPYKLSPDIMKRIRAKNHIIIYGAGQVGAALKELLGERGIDIMCFAVSSKGKIQQYHGVNVVEISELLSYQHSAAILIASLDYGNEMERTARNLGFEEVIKCI